MIMLNELKEWLAGDDNSEYKLREINELIHEMYIAAAARAPIYRAALAAVYAHARAVVYAADAVAAAAAHARDAVQDLVTELEKQQNNNTNNNDNAAKISELDLSEFLNIYNNVKICDLDITVNELFEKINECAQMLNANDHRMRRSAQGVIR